MLASREADLIQFGVTNAPVKQDEMHALVMCCNLVRREAAKRS